MTSAAGWRSTVVRLGEVVAIAVVGAVLAALAWSVIGLAVPAAIVGAANGAISGARRIYRWRSPTGWLAFALDSTWALVTTAGSLLAHTVAAVQRVPRNYVAELSERRDHHVYVKGYTIKRGFLLTVGNVISGAGAAARTAPRRQRVVSHHEHIHVWQSRWFGPLFPLLYTAWTLIGGLVGASVWVIRRPPEGLGRVIETWSYYSNPFEWWAYSREARWPPPGAIARFTWRRPATPPGHPSVSPQGVPGETVVQRETLG